MDEIIATIILGYVFNWMPGILIMMHLHWKKMFWLLLPYSFIYFLFKEDCY